MISVLIRAHDRPEALAATLASLVPAVADGLVADAVIVTGAKTGPLEWLADEAGATLVESSPFSWRDGARHARHEWLLCLEEGDLPEEGWIRVLDRFVSLTGRQADRARLRRRLGVFQRIRNGLAICLSPAAIRAGDLVRRDVLLGAKGRGAPIRLNAALERVAIPR